MSGCRTYRRLLKKYLGQDITMAEKNKLFNHSRNCSECRALIDLDEQFSEQNLVFSQPSDEEFTSMRQSVLRNVRQKQYQGSNSRLKSQILWLQEILFRPAVAYAVALVLFFAGLSINIFEDQAAFENGRSLIRQISYSAGQNSNISDMLNSPYSFSNVEMHPVNQNEVALSFNVSTHLNVVKEKNDPLVKEVLAQSLLNAQPLGKRLKSISYSEEVMDPKIKEALIFTALNDAVPAVRLKALHGLVKYQDDASIKEAMLTILKKEETMQMRLMAIDYLTLNNIDPERLSEEVSALETQNNNPVFRKVNQYLISNE